MQETLFGQPENPGGTPPSRPDITPGTGGRPPGITPPVLRPTPDLAVHASAYGRTGRRTRPGGDPLGRGGLPDTRIGIDELLLNLCERLIAAGGRFLLGEKLAADLGLPSTRSVRLLVAYGHVHHRLRQIVGLPGEGYCWGDFEPGRYGDLALMSRRMGICFLFNASLYSRRPAAVEMAQLALDFAERSGPGESLAGKKAASDSDELSAWLQVEGVSHSDLIDAMIAKFNTTDAGRAALVDAGRKHPGVFLPAEAVEQLTCQIDKLRENLLQTVHRQAS